ncbi:electron transporter RnfA [Pseudomonas sp. SWI6]|uniref:Electron transporter RnfA n=1 Tax=Pseudomonas taiwanensis TaxID=470150 RepID=A0ABR6VCQ3_9PSED|nr:MULTISPECIES: Rnf-Nqr domain containing protein [Pseudomonas]AVD84521.1 electron transporter RnfA [Pseudomonas sp. SWI6]AVD86750.1 electron transporter RnfA [Pseudomonas sp. SWI44]MBC3478160.1 electron transporter RnfA [Pseudomonas taiwanensis]MBC3493239.1 electron transporter RnfA [Pseudomonas taiwanensis]MPS98521.1 electron transporter RnfA [Pseudomonas sp.]
MNDYMLVLVSAALISFLTLQRQPASRLHVHVLGMACALAILLGVTGGQLLVRVLLVPWQLQDLQLLLLLPWLALVSWAVQWVLAKLRPDWPVTALTALMPAGAPLLGLSVQATAEGQGALVVTTSALLTGLGFWLALALFNDLRQRTEQADIPVSLRGLPIDLLGAGIMAMAFSGLNGLFTQ